MIALFLALSALNPIMALTEAEYQAILAKRHPLTTKTTDPPKRPKVLLRQDSRKPNKTEQRYAEDILRISEGIEYYEWEAITLKIGNGVKYTPDFLVIRSTGVVEIHEVKGPKVWEDSIIKIKAAAAKFHFFKFYIAQWDNGQWTIQQVLS